MSTNLHKAQKHMQRATELINQEGPLAFGTGDKGVLTREQKRRIDELEKRKKKRPRTNKRIKHEFSTQIQEVCYMYSVYNLLLRRLLNDSALNSLKSVKRAKEQLQSGGVLRVGRYTLEPEALLLYDLLEVYWFWKDEWDRTPKKNRSKIKEPQIRLSSNIPAYEKISTAYLTEGGFAGAVLQAIILATEEHNEIAVVKEYNQVFLKDSYHLYTFTTVHCKNGHASAKNEKVKSNSVIQTLEEIFENTYYDNKYIFWEISELNVWAYNEVFEIYDKFPGKDRLAGAFLTVVYDFDTEGKARHSVCMIPDGETFMVYDANRKSDNVFYEDLHLQDNRFFEKIEIITYVYSPKSFLNKIEEVD